MGRRKTGIATQQEEGAKIMIQNGNGQSDGRVPAAAQPSLGERMEDLRMSESDRQAAAEWLRDGESLADFICRATAALRCTAALLDYYFAQRSR
jgi:TPR repeat protein